MKQSEAKELVNHILHRAIYCRSVTAETLMGHGRDLGKIEKNVMNYIDKYVFPQDESYDGVGIVQIASRLQSKGDDLSPMDLYNLLTLVHKSTMLVFVLGFLDKIEVPEIHPIPKWMVEGWEEE